MIRFISILSVAIISFASCRSAKNIQNAITRKDTVEAPIVITPTYNPHEDSVNFIRETYRQIQEKQIPFTTFSGKIDVTYTDADGKNYNVNAHLRMYKDSVIWVSITAILGIEGLRAYITADSVKILNKQDKVYTARSVTYLQEVTELPLDLSALQNLLVGNPVFLDSNINSYSLSPGAISLQSNGEFFKNLFTIGQADKLARSSKLDDADESRSRTCYLTYDEYESKYNISFATRRTINVSETKKLDIKLDFKQFEFNETLSFPFSVPKNYKRN
ncbi:MAG: DUF4292 domain-containing protein [Chitinophagaceae bacterium]|nr:DUF4292 domain-containing protein [Chitinophagaceae bacterium]